MESKFIVTTTIQSPTDATLEFAAKKGWTLVVVGDQKTPHDAYSSIDCVYLHPDEQEKLAPKLSDAIGWNCIQRRNLGFLWAYQNGADVVATVDDDNIPYDTWGEDLLVGKTVDIDCWESVNGVFDPLSVTNHSELWHRGYPIQLVKTKNEVKYLGKRSRKVLVQASLWDGDPDVDAIARSIYQPCVKFDSFEPFGAVNRTPFNSQNTFLAREVIPYYMMIPGCGRMDDIWGGYFLQREFPDSVVYSKATVYQERNEHDDIVDMEKEIVGYRHTIDILGMPYYYHSDAIIHAYKAYRREYEQC